MHCSLIDWFSVIVYTAHKHGGQLVGFLFQVIALVYCTYVLYCTLYVLPIYVRTVTDTLDIFYNTYDYSYGICSTFMVFSHKS